LCVFAQITLRLALNGWAETMQGLTKSNSIRYSFTMICIHWFYTNSLHHFLKDIEMKKLALIAALGLMGMGSAMAQTATGNFDVNVTLTSACRMTTTTPALNFGTYVAFRATALTATPVAIAFECTRGLAISPPNVQFDAPAWGTTSAAGATATGEGVLAGLRYTMGVSNTGSTPGAAPVVATSGDIGTAATYTYTVTGSMPALQAGTAATGVQSHVRQLIVSF
jgi:hypothetical protein